MTLTKTPIKKLFKRYMVEADINSFLELSKVSGLDYQLLNVRMKQPETFRIYELRVLQEILNITQEDLLKIITGE